MEIVERVAVLGKDDEFAVMAARVSHLWIILQDTGQFFPFAILARSNKQLWPGFQLLQNFTSASSSEMVWAAVA